MIRRRYPLSVHITHRLFVKDDINHDMLVEISEPVTNLHQDFYVIRPKNKLKQEVRQNWEHGWGINSHALI